MSIHYQRLMPLILFITLSLDINHACLYDDAITCCFLSGNAEINHFQFLLLDKDLALNS